MVVCASAKEGHVNLAAAELEGEMSELCKCDYGSEKCTSQCLSISLSLSLSTAGPAESLPATFSLTRSPSAL